MRRALIAVPHSPGAQISADIAKRFPVAAVDQLERTDPSLNVLAEYGWGGYVIYRLHDQGGRVFVDGRNDMYSEKVLEDYSAIRNADDGWQALARSYGVQALLFPPDVPLVRGAAQSAGWCQAYRDATQVLLLAACLRGPDRCPCPRSGPPCIPPGAPSTGAGRFEYAGARAGAARRRWPQRVGPGDDAAAPPHGRSDGRLGASGGRQLDRAL